MQTRPFKVCYVTILEGVGYPYNEDKRKQLGTLIEKAIEDIVHLANDLIFTTVSGNTENVKVIKTVRITCDTLENGDIIKRLGQLTEKDFQSHLPEHSK